jgi:hypothetical protein
VASIGRRNIIYSNRYFRRWWYETAWTPGLERG